nr:uncharacterized protein LOC115934944 [Gorilla gorilla gorilla]
MQAKEGRGADLLSVPTLIFLPCWMLPALQYWTPGPSGFGLRLTRVVCQGLSGLWPQTEGCTVGFPTFEVLGIRLASSLLSLQMTYCGTSPCDCDITLVHYIDDIMLIGPSEQEVANTLDLYTDPWTIANGLAGWSGTWKKHD